MVDEFYFDKTALLSPEVIQAGAEMLRGYDLNGDLSEEVAGWVFCAMLEAIQTLLIKQKANK